MGRISHGAVQRTDPTIKNLPKKNLTFRIFTSQNEENTQQVAQEETAKREKRATRKPLEWLGSRNKRNFSSDEPKTKRNFSSEERKEEEAQERELSSLR